MQNTPLGWVIARNVTVSSLKSGRSIHQVSAYTTSPTSSHFSVSLHVNSHENTSLEKWVEKFWYMENIPEVLLTGEEVQAEKHFLQTTKFYQMYLIKWILPPKVLMKI